MSIRLSPVRYIPIPELSIKRLLTDADIAAAYPVMAELRPHLLEADFVRAIREQEAGGYLLLGGFLDGKVLCLAGYRDTATLARGRHLFVDDLITTASARGHGHGQAMLCHLAQVARSLGIARIYLDSRDTAMGFYRQVGFTFLTSVPCWIEVEALCS